VVEVLGRERRIDVVEGQAQLVQDAAGAGAEADPWIGRALLVAAVRRRAARADGHLRYRDKREARSPVEAHTRHEPACAAVRPPVLLPDADHVARVGPVDVDPGLDLAVQEDRAGLRADRVGGAAQERARSRDLDERSGRQSLAPAMPTTMVKRSASAVSAAPSRFPRIPLSLRVAEISPCRLKPYCCGVRNLRWIRSASPPRTTNASTESPTTPNTAAAALPRK
jgi:hypothetical protein